jgi:hypothetical protein
MKRISSYFAPAGEKREKLTATDETQNEAITTNLEYPSESGIEGQKKNEKTGRISGLIFGIYYQDDLKR